jgi:hypothetical protein
MCRRHEALDGDREADSESNAGVNQHAEPQTCQSANAHADPEIDQGAGRLRVLRQSLQVL